MIALIVATTGVIGAALWFSREPVETLLQKAQLALVKKQYDVAEGLALRVLDREANSSAALVIAGEAAKEQGDIDRAIAFFDRIPDDGSPDAVAARRNTGRIYLLDKKRLSLAEEQFRRCLAQDPDDVLAMDGMAYVLGVSGQYRELIPYRLKLIGDDKVAVIHLVVLSIGNRLLADVKEAPPYIEAAPDDALELICQADIRILADDPAGAIAFAKKAAVKMPHLPKPHLVVLNFLMQMNDLREFQAYHARLGTSLDGYSDIWLLRGMYCQRCGRTREAVRCFWESVRRDADQQYSNYQLSQLLASLDERDSALAFARRGNLLREYISTSYAALSADASNPQTLRSLTNAAQLAEKLGLIWEAYGWYRIASQHQPSNRMLAEKVNELKPTLAKLPLQRSPAEFNPALKIDLSEYPLPDVSSISPPDTAETIVEGDVPRGIKFEESSTELGIDFSYFSGRDPLTQGMRETFEFNGGGVAVIDFDLDRWPDLYFTQGSDWPNNPAQTTHLDPLYRNGGGDRFQNVAAAAGIVESGFGQGAAVGDFNSDGFPDLYIANIDRNRLYENNGDGTFTDVTASAGLDDKRWTTSCLIADLNGDGLPDLYDVNYMTDPDLFTRVCKTAEGARYACPPQSFSPEIDQLHLNRGDGTFENVSSASGIANVRGRGLGIVAWDLDRSGTLDLYVANDVGPNFFFLNETAADDPLPRFSEQAPVMGLALNVDGNADSGMGIACGDVDGDLLLDLFITNFYEESNSLYIQQQGGLFVETSKNSGLRDTSLPMVAFGTQFLDPDLDGNLDVVIANGHITDLRESRGQPLQMKPQYYHGNGRGQFAEADPESVGPYFARELLGRGLARLDWNRDGRDDFAVSHLDAPVSLVTNASSAYGNHIALRFVGIRSARDAIGTSVTLTTGTQKRIHQLIAGDGYQASNERLLIIGLGEAIHVDELEIAWPSGDVQRFASLPVNEEYLFLEGGD
ncbi:MAG: FG-GAP-like repeat-containing protein, partial [Planctomycetaceae bacterium]